MSLKKRRCFYDGLNAGDIIVDYILSVMEKLDYSNDRELVIVGVGTDCSTGDSLGPLTGFYLEKAGIKNVYGTIHNPVHASNLQDNIEYIYDTYENPFVIAIDAGLGKESSVGYIDVSPKPLKPGSGVNKVLPEVGDMHITGLVNVGGYMEYLMLQSTRLSIVFKMADIISNSIIKVIERINSEIENVDIV